jgi:hypothetical protein
VQPAHGEDFMRQHRSIHIGRLNVPAAFKVENYDYREGIVTTLVNEDGSRITLQSAGIYSHHRAAFNVGPLPPGNYVLVFDNRFSAVSQKYVGVQADLNLTRLE